MPHNQDFGQGLLFTKETLIYSVDAVTSTFIQI